MDSRALRWQIRGMSLASRIGFWAFAALLPVSATAAPLPPPADPLTVSIQTEDADRFAALFAATNGKPTAEQIQRSYLDPGSYGVEVFTPDRIVNAQALATRIAEKPDSYRIAIAQCLPVVKQANAELRAIYLGLRGLFPTRPLPQIYVVFGGGNSGGTAGPGAQVLGLEVLCAIAPTPEKLRRTLRMFFAHETVHTWRVEERSATTNPLLRDILVEGAADYIASLVLGGPPDEAREAWAPPREAELWRQLTADLATIGKAEARTEKTRAARQAAFLRWVHNYGMAPEDWPIEMGYWMGMRVWQRYVDAVADKRAALEHVLGWTDARLVLEKGAYRPQPNAVRPSIKPAR